MFNCVIRREGFLAEGVDSVLASREHRHLLGEPVTGWRTIFDELNRPIVEERLKGVAIAFNLKGEVGETRFTPPVEQDILTCSERRYDQAGAVGDVMPAV
ncbi:MAG TPA: hypothetical protein VEH27_15235 [Methylomirabilota bacterium]|nr:hypothetical protein [Methylomirabilota bacterium]